MGIGRESGVPIEGRSVRVRTTETWDGTIAQCAYTGSSQITAKRIPTEVTNAERTPKDCLGRGGVGHTESRIELAEVRLYRVTTLTAVGAISIKLQCPRIAV